MERGISVEILRHYFDLQQQIYAYFGYEENWVVIPLDDCTRAYWWVEEDALGRGIVVYSHEPFTPELIRAGEQIYNVSIYTQRHLSRWVYRGEAYSMICVDTHTDGNKFLMVFDNTKEIDAPALRALWHECWGNTWCHT